MAWRLRIALPPRGLLVATGILAVIVGALSGAQPRLGLLAAFGVVFVVAVMANLLIGFAVMVLLAFLEVLSSLGGVSIAKAAGLLLVISWLAVASTRSTRTRNFFVERPGLTYLLVAFIGWNTISIAWSESHSGAITSVTRYALNAVLVPIAYAAIRDRRDAIRILATLVGGATIAAVSGIVAAPGPESAVYGRATGTIGDPNELAAALVVGLAVATAFAVNRHVQGALRALSAGSAVLCLAGILLSLSRGGLIGVGAGLLFAVVVGGRWRWRVLAVCAAVAFLGVGYFAFLASLPAKERVLNVGGAGGGTGRLDLWTVGLRMVSAHPVRGVGTGQFANSSVHYLLRPGVIERGDFILSTPKVAHNTYLNIVSELGLVGGALFAAILVMCVASLWRAIQRTQRDGDEKLEILLRGLLVGMGGYFVTLMFISENYAKLLWILLALGPTLLAVVRAQPARRDRGRRIRAAPLEPLEQQARAQ
jgi:O-antigen ligase